MRALVIMPRSPTMTIFFSPNLSCTTPAISVNAAGSAVFPSKTRTATGRLGVGEQPVLDLHVALLAVAGVAARPERAVRALQPRRRQVEQGHPGRVRVRGEVPAGELLLDRVLPGLQPVHRRVGLVGGGAGDAEVGAERHVAPPGEGGKLRARAGDPGDDQGQGQVPLAAGRAEEPGQAELAGHRVDGGDVPVGQRPRDGDRRSVAGRGEGLAFQCGLDRVDHVVGELRQVGEGLVADLAAVAVGAAQQTRLVLAPLSLLVGVRALDPGHVHRRRLLHHDRSLAACSRETRRHAMIFLATYQCRRETRVPGQARDSYSEAP